MTFPQIRLLVSGLLLAGWLSYLGFLAATTTNPVVVSRPQLLDTSAVVIAEVPGSPSNAPIEVKIREVKRDSSNSLQPDQTIKVHLKDAGRTPKGWTGAGEYILVLSTKADGSFVITPIPPSPGFPDPEQAKSPQRRWIYPVTPNSLAQLDRILEPTQSTP